MSSSVPSASPRPFFSFSLPGVVITDASARSSLHASLFPSQVPHATPALPALSTRAALLRNKAMTGSLLLDRLSACIRAGTDLVLRCVAARNGSGQRACLRLAGGVGVQVAVAEDLPEAEERYVPVEESQSRVIKDGVKKKVLETKALEKKATKCTRGELLALVVSHDAVKAEPLLSHVLKPPPLSLSIKLYSEQQAVLLARLSVFDAMLSEQLHAEHAPDQLVLFAPGLHACPIKRQSLTSPLSIFAINDASLAVQASADAARLNGALPDDVDYVHVEAVLDGWVWDSGLVLHGYNWQRTSLWVVFLDVADFEQERLERHFCMIGTLASVDSLVLAVYVTPEFAHNVRESDDEQWKGDAPTFSCDDPFAFAKKCGFQVSYATSLRDAAIKHGLPMWLRKQLATSLFADGIRFASFSHLQRNLPPVVTPDVDDVSEVTALSGFSASVSAASAAAPLTPLQFGDNSLLGEFEDYVSSDTRMLCFEMQVTSIPPDLAIPDFSVVVIGSEPSFGCWDPKQAKKMYGKICAASGVMTADLSLSVEASDVEYKYAITNARQEIMAWEVGSNRILASSSEEGSVALANVQYIRDEWRS